MGLGSTVSQNSAPYRPASPSQLQTELSLLSIPASQPRAGSEQEETNKPKGGGGEGLPIDGINMVPKLNIDFPGGL